MRDRQILHPTEAQLIQYPRHTDRLLLPSITTDPPLAQVIIKASHHFEDTALRQ